MKWHVRYAGLFSSRWKHRYLTQARSALGQDETSSSTSQPPTWAERQQEYTGISPLTCPECCKPLVYLGLLFASWDDLKALFIHSGQPAHVPAALLKPG